MLGKHKFSNLQEQGLIASVRVVPVPLSKRWCIDAVVRTPMEPGSVTNTISSPTADASTNDKLRTFESIDEASQFLKSVGINTFTVDLDDAISFVNTNQHGIQMVETTMRLWSDDIEEAVN